MQPLASLRPWRDISDTADIAPLWIHHFEGADTAIISRRRALHLGDAAEFRLDSALDSVPAIRVVSRYDLPVLRLGLLAQRDRQREGACHAGKSRRNRSPDSAGACQNGVCVRFRGVLCHLETSKVALSPDLQSVRRLWLCRLTESSPGTGSIAGPPRMRLRLALALCRIRGWRRSLGYAPSWLRAAQDDRGPVLAAPQKPE